MMRMGHDLKSRIRNTVGSQKAWADATGMSFEQVSRILAGAHPVPEWWLALLELLERLPIKDWPDRWKR